MAPLTDDARRLQAARVASQWCWHRQEPCVTVWWLRRQAQYATMGLWPCRTQALPPPTPDVPDWLEAVPQVPAPTRRFARAAWSDPCPEALPPLPPHR